MMRDPVQQRLILALTAELIRVRHDVGPDLASASEEIQKVVVAQNALRTCMEVAVEDAIPFGPAFPIELAIRLASYAISILPDGDQQAAVQAVVGGLPSAHGARMAQGVRINAEWGRAN